MSASENPLTLPSPPQGSDEGTKRPEGERGFRTYTAHYHPTLSLLALLTLGGCTAISVAPTCPNELQVGETAPLLANELNPGEIAKYAWEVIPPLVGKVTDPTKPSTTFEATSEGEAVIRLTASDGLYQVISECTIRVAGRSLPTDDSDNDNANDNTNANTNDNANDNVNDNANDNDTGNDNTADNTNDNVDDGKEDNSNDNVGRPGGVRKAAPPPPG